LLFFHPLSKPSTTQTYTLSLHDALPISLGRNPIQVTTDLLVLAECQRLMLLAHASVTAGMKLAGFRYEKPKYVIPSIPPYSLIVDRKSTRLNSSHDQISYAVFCLKKKKK